jgi:hypothetical protein
MRANSSVRLSVALSVVLVVVVALPGCGSNELESPTAKKLRALGNFYLEYAVAKNGKGPENEQELKKHIRATPDHVLSVNEIDRASIDSLFSSERDREPFVVVYGQTIKQVGGNSAPVVAHEKSGANGKRLVGFANGKVELVDESRLNELLAAK